MGDCHRADTADFFKITCSASGEPQLFDFTKYGFGKSKALYFKDPDGIILELMEKIS